MKSEVTLKSILDELLEVKRVAETCLDDIPWNTKTAWGTMMENAKAQLTELRAQYKDKLLQNSLAMFVSGPHKSVDEFVALAHEEGGTITLDADELYTTLAFPVERALGTERTFTSSMLPILLRGIKEMAENLNLREIPAPQMDLTQVVANFGALVILVKTLLRRAMGDDLNRRFLAFKLAQLAEQVRYKGSVVPVMVRNATPDEIVGLASMFGTVAPQIYLTDQDITKEFVVEKFKESKKNKNRKQEKAE